MATITIEVVAGQTATHSKTVSGAHLARLLAAERTLRNMPSATDAQTIQAVADSFFAFLRARVRHAEEAAALATASAAVTEIALT